jgi:Holliday junction resolvase YEN1
MVSEIDCAISQQGLPGCGPKAASALSAFGFGDSLCTSARALSRFEFSRYLAEWRDDVRSFLQTDPLDTLGSRRPALADSITDNFPNIDIVYLYIYPLTSSAAKIATLGSRQSPPDIVQVTRLCELYFEWAVPATIFAKFDKGLFAAVVMSALRQEVVVREFAVLHYGLQRHTLESDREVCCHLLLSTLSITDDNLCSCRRILPL